MNAILKDDLNSISLQLKEDTEKLKGCNLFVSGGTGFVGKWLVSSLLFINDVYKLNMKIVVLSRNPDKSLKEHSKIFKHQALSFLKGDVRDFIFPTDNFQYIIHAATEADAEMNIDNPMLMSDVIMNGTKRMLEFAVHCKAQKFLFLSSGAVYGKQPQYLNSFDEEYIGAPITIEKGGAYAHSKRLAEFYCSYYSMHFGFKSVIARCFAFVGPYLPLEAHYAVGNFINDGLKHRNIEIKSDGEPLRSYMYASDMVVSLIKLMIKHDETSIVNIGSKDAISIKELAMTVASYFPGVEVKVLNQVRSIDRNYNYIPDTKKAERIIGISPWISIDEAIRRTIKFYKEETYD